MQRVESHVCFGGRQEVWAHQATTLGVEMKLGVYLPPKAVQGSLCPVLWFLSGLTCTEQNVIQKAGLQRACAQHGLILVSPDTSPRGEGVADDPGYDLGQGAGFYLDATEEPWKAHYQMESYITQELPALVREHFPASERQGVTGHSMGGHGALVLWLRNPGLYRSVSAFAPIVAPSEVPWGDKAFSAYLGSDRAAWRAHDATALIGSATERLPILIDQGTADPFLEEQLQPARFEAACKAADHPLNLRMHEGYDHSYYFIASFAADHVKHHAAALLA